MSEPFDLAGQRFGALIAVRVVGKSKLGRIWECHCDCGGTVNRVAAQLRYHSKRVQACNACSEKSRAGAFRAQREKNARDNRKRSLVRLYKKTGSLFGSNDGDL